MRGPEWKSGLFGIIKLMPDQPLLEFSHEVLEKEIERLSQEISHFREQPENSGFPEREVVKQSLGRVMPSLGAEREEKPQVSPDKSSSVLPEYARNVSLETKLEIEHLLDLALHKGLDEANAVASKTSPFVLDTFHDLLVEKFYPELQKRGLIK